MREKVLLISFAVNRSARDFLLCSTLYARDNFLFNHLARIVFNEFDRQDSLCS